ncbi:MAG: hypothetical protein ABR576_03085 [Thermoanaerobaculia bacterium]
MKSAGRGVIGAMTVALASAGLFLVSLGKWTDPIVDIGNEWIWPDALSRGDLLYRDVVYWFGPLTPYFHSVFFRLFGSSFSALVLAGCVASLAILAAFFFALRTVTGKREAALWTAAAIPALVFMRYSGGSILGMGFRMWHAAGFALLAGALASRAGGGRRRWYGAAAGACAGLAGLCRTEWGMGALLAVLLGLAVRRSFGRGAVRESLPVIAAALGVFGSVIGAFVWIAGPDPVLRESLVLLSGIPPEVRKWLVDASGVREWRRGVLSLLHSTAFWLAAYWLVEILTLRRIAPDRAKRRLPWLLACLALLAGGALLGPARGSVLFSWSPAVCAAAVVVGLSRGPRGGNVVTFATMGLIFSGRRFFDLRDFGYAAPPILFALVAAAGLMRHAVRREKGRSARLRLRRAFQVAAVALVSFLFLLRGIQYRADHRVPIPGTAGMLTGSETLARELTIAAREIRTRTPPGGGLVVFPDAAILNFLADRRNSLRHKLYVPGYLTEQNEAAVLSELMRASPAAVAIVERADGQEPPRLFGVTYGRRIHGWIDRHYLMVRVEGGPPDAARGGYPMLLGFRRDAEPRPIIPAP